MDKYVSPIGVDPTSMGGGIQGGPRGVGGGGASPKSTAPAKMRGPTKFEKKPSPTDPRDDDQG